MRRFRNSFFISVCLLSTIACACQVPVFRYALERWPADRYEMVVIYDGLLKDGDRKIAKELMQSDHRSAAKGNYSVRFVNQIELKEPALKRAWQHAGKDGSPVLASLYPRDATDIPDRLIDVVPLSEAAIQGIADSPVRQEIAKRLISGESAVWIFVPCGDEKQDKVALASLQSAITANEKNLELPEQDEIEEEEELLEQVDIELRLDFSILTLRRDDPKEKFLLKILLGSESDLRDLDQPMAFPVLGRGRVLYALVGAGIAEETIGIASRFIIGPCSCQVKNQNPGFDLLMSCDWDKKIGKAKLSDPLPEDTGKPILLSIPPGR